MQLWVRPEKQPCWQADSVNQTRACVHVKPKNPRNRVVSKINSVKNDWNNGVGIPLKNADVQQQVTRRRIVEKHPRKSDTESPASRRTATVGPIQKRFKAA